MVPTTIPRSSLHALEELPSTVLSSLHTASDWDKVTKDKALMNWLSKNPMPAVCDACAGNCSSDLFDLFDQNGVFMGGTHDTASATGFSFSINCIVRPDVYDSGTQCVIKGADALSACIYPPPLVDGAIYSTLWDAASGWLSGWFDVPGGGAAKPCSPVTAIARYPTHLDLFVTGTDARIYSTYWDAASSWASGWFPIGNSVAPQGSVVTAIARNPDHLDLFITDQAGMISSTYWDAGKLLGERVV